MDQIILTTKQQQQQQQQTKQNPFTDTTNPNPKHQTKFIPILSPSSSQQPGQDTFSLFDRLLILSAGKVVYTGPRTKATTYFTDLGYKYDGISNSADFIIEVAGGMPCTNEIGSADHIKSPKMLAEAFVSSAMYSDMDNNAIDRNTTLSSNEKADDDVMRSKPSSLAQARVLLSRGSIANKRNTSYIRAQFMKNIIVGLISGCIFYKQGSMSSAVFSTVTKLPTAAGYNVSSILYFALLYAITGNLQAIPSLFSSKLLFLRERESGCYSTLPYFLANSIVHLPLIILTHIGFINLTYWLVGKKNSLEYQYPLFYLF